ncbi:MAG: multidrug effflux MFS transporter [Pseudomonadota bacterium]
MHLRFAYIIVLSASAMLAPFAIDLYLPAFPAISAGFGTGIDEIEATVAIYLVGSAIGQIVLGPIADAYGRRRVLISGIALFVVASLLLGASKTLDEFYFWRFMQAIGGAGSVAVFPIVRDQFGPRDSPQVISYMMAVIVIAPIIAPVIGGYVLLFTNWRAIFGLIAVIGAAVLLSTLALIEENRVTVKTPKPLRIFSHYRAVFAEPRVCLSILTSGFAFGGLFAFVAGAPYVYISYFGIAAENFGYLFALNAAAMIVANVVNGRLSLQRNPVKRVVAGAGGMLAAGGAIFFAAITGSNLFVVITFVIVFFFALAFVETNALIIALSVRPDINGSVAAVNGAFQFGAGAIASFLVSVFDASSALPMAFVMAGSGALTFLASLLLQRGGFLSRAASTCGADR